MRLLRQPIISTINNHLVKYPTPSNLNYYWGFGSLAGICLVFQIISGVLLAMHYTPHVSFAFDSVEHIMRDINYGWLFRYMHSNGASMFFIVLYTHIGRGLYYGSYLRTRAILWASGVLLFFLTMATAFMGYVLPWGQMSFWGATVITNFVTAIPVIGDNIALWLWGGFSVDNPTLNRFFSLHYLLPFIIAGISVIHLVLLHNHESNNPLGISKSPDKITFYPYFYLKDLVGLMGLLIIFAAFVFFNPDYLSHPDNYITANPLVTPKHIVPEWYFLPYYAILRAIPNKLGGVCCMIISIAVLFALPLLGASTLSSSNFRPMFNVIYWLFVANLWVLLFIGKHPVESPYTIIGAHATGLYFLLIFFAIPLCCFLERKFFFQSLINKG